MRQMLFLETYLPSSIKIRTGIVLTSCLFGQALRGRHDQALEVIGACDEKIRTLEDDISDMKHIFHTQLSSLVDEVNSLRSRTQPNTDEQQSSVVERERLTP